MLRLLYATSTLIHTSVYWLITWSISLYSGCCHNCLTRWVNRTVVTTIWIIYVWSRQHWSQGYVYHDRFQYSLIKYTRSLNLERNSNRLSKFLTRLVKSEKCMETAYVTQSTSHCGTAIPVYPMPPLFERAINGCGTIYIGPTSE